MIAWSIQSASESGCFDKIIVSTDDYEIAEIAIKLGAEVPFIRPLDLSDDFTPTVPVIAHSVSYCKSLGWDVQYSCCIYPCAPTILSSDLVKAYRLLLEHGLEYVYPVTEYVHPIQRAMRRLDGGIMQFIYPENELTRTQDLERTYHDAGMFYFGRSSAWLAHKPMHSSGFGMPIPNWRVVDIDTKDDWNRAEVMFAALKDLDIQEHRG
jgi:pseudaminic acid cytidylyltransferase